MWGSTADGVTAHASAPLGSDLTRATTAGRRALYLLLLYYAGTFRHPHRYRKEVVGCLYLVQKAYTTARARRGSES